MKKYHSKKHLLFVSVLLCASTFASVADERTIEVPKKTLVTEAMKKQPMGFRPYSAEHNGDLTPVDNIHKVITGNTIVLAQPWVNLKDFEIRKTPVYFNKQGKANSELWINIPWKIKGNLLCMAGKKISNCYLAYSDSNGQAYLMETTTKLLAKVDSIETGNPYHVIKSFETRQARIKARQERQMVMFGLFAGLLGEAMINSGSGQQSCDRQCMADNRIEATLNERQSRY